MPSSASSVSSDNDDSSSIDSLEDERMSTEKTKYMTEKERQVEMEMKELYRELDILKQKYLNGEINAEFFCNVDYHLHKRIKSKQFIYVDAYAGPSPGRIYVFVFSA